MIYRKAYGVLVSIFLIGLYASNVFAAKHTIRFAGNQPDGHPLTMLQYKFKELTEKYSNGQIEVKVYIANQLGGITEVNEAVRDGSLTMGMSSVTYIAGNYNKKFSITNLPYLVDRSNISVLYSLMDGAVGQKLSNELKTNNLKVVGYYQLGFRNVTNRKRPVDSPDDLKGLKIRLQPNKVHIRSFEAFGANPVSMDWAEVYSAMQQGVIDGQENPIDIIYMNKFYEVQKFCTLTGHFFDIGAVFMNLDFYNSLPKKMQDVVQKAGAETMRYQRKLSSDREQEFINKLSQKMDVRKLSEENLRRFKMLSKPVYQDIRKIILDDQLVDEFLSAFK